MPQTTSMSGMDPSEDDGVSASAWPSALQQAGPELVPLSTIPLATLARASSASGFGMMTRSRSFVEPLPGVYKEAHLAQSRSAPEPGLLSKIDWHWDLLAIGLVYFVEGILDMMSLAVTYYLKESLSMGPTAAGLAQTLCQLPWQATPLLALVTDGVPVCGYHRKGYLLLVGLVGALCWLLLAGAPAMLPSMLLIVVANACTAWTQVIADAVTVKLSQGKDQVTDVSRLIFDAQEAQVAAFYQSYSWGTYMVGGVLSAYTTGELLDSQGPRPVFVLAAGCLLLDGACALMIQEDSRQADTRAGGGGGGLDTTVGSPVQRGVQVLVQVWHTLRTPHIFVPALFIFLWQSSPSPTSAMFYFQTNVLGFTARFQELVYLCGVLAALGGVLVYNCLLVDKPMRTMLLWSALCATLLNATQLILVSRVNLKLGLSDKLFVLGDYAMLAAVAEVMMTPMLAIAARVCPDGIEATLYASLYCVINLSTALSTAFGALATRLLHVTEANFHNLFWLMLLCNLWMLLPLPLLAWVPDNLEPPGIKTEEQQPLLVDDDTDGGGGNMHAGAPRPGLCTPNLSLSLIEGMTGRDGDDLYLTWSGENPPDTWHCLATLAPPPGTSGLPPVPLSPSAAATPVVPGLAAPASLPAVFEHVDGLPHLEGTSPSATLTLGRLGFPVLAPLTDLILAEREGHCSQFAAMQTGGGAAEASEPVVIWPQGPSVVIGSNDDGSSSSSDSSSFQYCIGYCT